MDGQARHPDHPRRSQRQALRTKVVEVREQRDLAVRRGIRGRQGYLPRGLLLLQRPSPLGEAGGLVAAVRMPPDVLRAGELVTVPGVQPGDPALGQCVAGGVAVEEMAREKVGAERPGRAKGEDPDGGEPHPRVVVQPTLLHELDASVFETVDAGPTLDGRLVGPPQARLGREPPRICD